MTDRKTLEAALVALESQRAILGDAVVDTSIAAIQTKLDNLIVFAVPTDKMISVLLLVRLPHNQSKPDLLTGHIQRCIERQHGQNLLIDDNEQIAIFQFHDDEDNVVNNAIYAAQAIQVAPQANRATASLIPPMQIAIQSVIVREGIAEPHDFLAHLQTPLHDIRAALEESKPIFEAHEQTTVVISEAALSFVQNQVRVGEAFEITNQHWFVIDDLNHPTLSDGLLYPNNVVPRLIERKSELNLLQQRYRETISKHQCHIVSIVGVMGVGKTRLLTEYELWLDLLIERIWFFKGQASRQQHQTPYALFRNVIQHRFSISDYDLPETTREKLVNGVKGLLENFPEEDVLIMGHLLGLEIGAVPLPARVHVDEAIQRDILFPIVCGFFRQITQLKDNALSLILEDLQWADAESLNLLIYLMEHCQEIRLVCVCTMRPTMFEHVSDWTTRLEATEVTHNLVELRSMTEVAIRQILDSILRQRLKIPEESAQAIIRRANGNPFLLEELVHLLIEEEVIDTSTFPWRFNEQQFEAIELPTTLMGLIQARLFSLPPEERLTLQRAATIGDLFWESALAYLNGAMPTLAVENTTIVLQKLEQKRLIIRIGDAIPEYGGAYRFVHSVWQLVAYDSLPQQSLQAMHTALSQWYIGQGLDHSGNNAKLVAQHFELAGEYKRAAKWYGMAARKAQESRQPTVAVRYYEQALVLYEDDDADVHITMALYEGLGETLILLARYVDAASVYSKMSMAAEAAGDLVSQARAWNRQVDIEVNRSDTESAMNCAIRAMETAESAGNAGRVELANAWYHIGHVYLSQQHAHEAEEWLRKALPLSETLKTYELNARIEKAFGHFCVLQNDYSAAISHFQRSLERFRAFEDVAGICNLLSNLADVFRRQGDYDQARDLLIEALKFAEETRSRRDMVYCLSDLAGASTMQGQYQVAKSQLEQVVKMTLADGWWGIVGTYRYLTQANLGLDDTDGAMVTAQLTLDWAQKRNLPSDFGIAWRVLGMTAAAIDRPIAIEEMEYTATQCFEKSAAYLEKVDMGELAETYRIWAEYEFEHGNEFKGDELWQMAGQCFAEIGATIILNEMNIRRNFT